MDELSPPLPLFLVRIFLCNPIYFGTREPSALESQVLMFESCATMSSNIIIVGHAVCKCIYFLLSIHPYIYLKTCKALYHFSSFSEFMS